MGDMLELGENSLAEHRNILQNAVENLKGAEILTVGSNFGTCAADFKVEAFPDSAAAGRRLKKSLAPGKWVFLKGSNSMHMSKALEQE